MTKKTKRLLSIFASTAVLIGFTADVTLNSNPATVNAAKKHKNKKTHKKITKKKTKKSKSSNSSTNEVSSENSTLNDAISKYNHDQFDYNSLSSTVISFLNGNQPTFLVKNDGLTVPAKYEHSSKGLSESASDTAAYMNNLDSYLQSVINSDPEEASNLVTAFYKDPSYRFQEDIINPNASKINPTDLQKIKELYNIGQYSSNYSDNYMNAWNNAKQYYITLAKIFASL